MAGIAVALGSLDQLRTSHPHSLVVAACTWALLVPLFFRRRWNRVFERASIWLASAIRNRANGRIRVTGTVAASSCFPTAVAGRPAVLARYQGCDSADETHGIDFHLVADDGSRFFVHVSDQTFLDAGPSRARRGEQAECSIGPGDRVTANGVVVAEVDAGSDRAGPRETPLRRALVGSEDAPLVIRPVSF